MKVQAAEMIVQECERLRANINSHACKVNRQRNVFACKGCPGLGAQIKIDTQPIIDREEGKPVAKNPIFKEEGCTTTSWKGGYCWKHHPENLFKKGLVKKSVAPVEIEELEEAAVIESYPNPPVKEIEPDPPVTDHEVHVVNLIDVFKQKQAAELAAFSNRLSEIKDPVAKLLFTYEAVQI